MAELFKRYGEFDRAKIDADKRTVPIAFSSEMAVDRGGYDEILDHDHADISRLRDSAALLLNHDPDKQIGVVESAEVRDKTGRAIVRFGNSALANEIFQDVKDGVRKHVSVGYDRTKAISRQKLDGGRDAIRFAFTPYELSIVPIPADTSVGVGRAEQNNDPLNDPMKRNLLFEAVTTGGGGTAAPTVTEAERSKMSGDILTIERKRIANIRAAADALTKNFPEAAEKFRGMANKADAEGTTSENFNAELLAAIPGIRKADLDTANIGLSDKEKKRYSMLRGIQSILLKGKIEGFEKECHDEVVKRSSGLGESSGNSFLMPGDVCVDMGSAARGYAMSGRRDLNVTTASQGGNFVATQLMTPIIEILRNRMICQRLGVQTLSGLQGNVSIPRQSGAATAYTLAEAAVLTKSTQSINQISLAPHRVGAYNSYTKQLLLQGSVDVDNFVRDDMMKVLAIKLDSLILQGAGGSDPLGILNTTGIGSLTFGGAATWANMILFETKLSLANADVGNMAYATSPDVRGKLKAAAKIGSTFPTFIWETPGNNEGPNDGIVNGYRAAVTNQILNSLVYFGNWEDDVLAMWGGYDVVVDPFTGAANATVNIAINTWVDNAVRHAASFAVSTDSGAQ